MLPGGNHAFNDFVTTFAPFAKSSQKILPMVGRDHLRPLYQSGYCPVVRNPTRTAPAVVLPLLFPPKKLFVSCGALRKSNCGQPLIVYRLPSYVSNVI